MRFRVTFLSFPLWALFIACRPQVVGSLGESTETAGVTGDASGPGSDTIASSNTTNTTDVASGTSGTSAATTGAPATTTGGAVDLPADESSTTGGGPCTEDCPAALQISTSGNHTCALIEGGRVRCWGLGGDGALGFGDKESIGDNEVPATLPDVDVGGTAVEVVTGGGGAITCARLAPGDVRCWGGNEFSFVLLGPQGNESIGDDELPSSVPPLDLGGEVTQLALGGHACALMAGGKVRCWGDNYVGQLGYGHTDAIGDDEPPGAGGDVDIGDTVLQLSVSPSAHTCALLPGGRVRCWGHGNNGELGYGTFDPNGPDEATRIGDDETPASMGDVPVGGFVVHVSAGTNHTCAVLDTGALRCWGDSTDGRLGYDGLDGGTVIGDDEPAGFLGDVPIGAPVVQVAAGQQHTCAVLDDGAVRCWGGNTFGKLGLGNNIAGTQGMPLAEVPDVLVGGEVVSLSVREEVTCALMSTGAARCWGGNNWGQLGYGHTADIGDNEVPADVGDIPIL